MDSNHFDDVIRNLSSSDSRRGALRLLAGALGSLASARAADALAKGKGKGKGKKKRKKSDCSKKKCPQGFVRDKHTCDCQCLPQPCPDGKQFDVDSCHCECPLGFRPCGDGCIGPDQCCPTDEPCLEDPRGCCIALKLEVCTIDGCCPEVGAVKVCNGFCIDTNSDSHHCGDCNVACRPGETCHRGQCKPGECPEGMTNCDGECVDTQTNENHCGNCGRKCAPDDECCGGECVVAKWDPENCGACGVTCDARTEACSQGQCHEICSLNTEYTVACDDGVDHWCCPERSPQCCRLSGQPHCC